MAVSVICVLRQQTCRAAIAQLGERQTDDLKVPGSIPGLGKLLIVHMVGNSWGLRKLGRDDLGDFSFKKNNACSSVDKTSKSSRLAFLNVDLGLPYCRRKT